MAYEKTNWVNGETPINAENLNKMEQGIEDANKSGGNVVDTFNVEDKTTNAPSIRAVEDKLSYSLEEKQIGYWVDGKPLYRKTYNTYEQSNSVYYVDRTDFVKNINIKIGEGSVLIEHQTIAGANYILPIAKCGSPLGDFYWSLNKYDKNLYVERTNYTSEYKIVGIEFTIYYTKTTD